MSLGSIEGKEPNNNKINRINCPDKTWSLGEQTDGRTTAQKIVDLNVIQKHQISSLWNYTKNSYKLLRNSL